MTNDVIENGKYVELKYQVIDRKSNDVLTAVEYPLGYVHGVNEILAPPIMAELEGRGVGDTLEVPIDCTQLYGDRDEALVFTDHLENVPKEYQEVGLSILMQNDNGQNKNFLVTRVDETSVTFDGNNPLCGREVIFKLNILTVREATEEEVEAGGKVEEIPHVEGGKVVPI